MRIRRAGGGGIYLVGRRYYWKLKRLRPGQAAQDFGVWQVQHGRWLARLSRTLAEQRARRARGLS